jgi:hypothetical protein
MTRMRAGHKNAITSFTFYAHALPQDDMSGIADRLTASRQGIADAHGDLNDDFAKTGSREKPKIQRN